jgi:hypothetical protein
MCARERNVFLLRTRDKEYQPYETLSGSEVSRDKQTVRSDWI